MNKILLTCALLITGIYTIMAQVTVEARIDSIEMMIGEQAHVTVTATAPENAKVEFASYKPEQMMTPGVEVLHQTDMDTKALDNGMAAFSVVYTLTSFDGKLYYLPPFKAKVNGREYKSASLALKVMEVEVDTANVDKFFGPKDVQDNPFDWKEWSTPFWMSIVALILMLIGIYTLMLLRHNKPVKINISFVKRLLPHQEAMKEIEIIKGKKHEYGGPKEYYTMLTDTLRKYIHKRYGFSAMEMTTSEIIQRLMALDDKKAIEELKTLFETADLVKFAKHSTLINEDDLNLVNAIDFINKTKVDEETKVEKIEKPLSETEKTSIKERKILITIISVAFAVTALLMAYVIWMLSQLM